jgi:putative ABC transport system permease protein
MVLWKFSIREMLSRPGRAVLTLLSIVIGVAAVVSVTVATSTTRRAYRDMFASVNGRAALDVVAEGGGSLDEKVLSTVAEAPGVQAAVPLLQRPTSMQVVDRKIRVMLLGIDTDRDAAVRNFNISKGRMFEGGKELVLEEGFAENLGISVGDEVLLLTPRLLQQQMTVVGLLHWQGAAVARFAGLVFLPLSRAQYLFKANGKVDTIQIVTDEAANVKEVAAQIAQRLPVGLTVRPPMTHTQQLEETLLASEQGLELATVFCFLLALFVILNTFLMNVSERRKKLSILRAIGATRRQIMRLLLAESATMGVVGTVLGIGVGLGGASLLVGALGKLLMVTLPPMQIPLIALFWAVVFGLGPALFGAAIPAYRAGRVSPLEGMMPVAHEDLETSSRRFTIAGTLALVTGGAALTSAIVGWLPMQAAVSSGGVILLGAVLLMRPLLGTLSHVALWLLFPLLRVEARLAHRQVLRHRTRSALTVGVLFLAISTGVGLANAILDNVRNVREWERRAIVGDFFVRAMLPDMATGTSAALPEELGVDLREIPGVANLDTISIVQIRAADQAAMAVVRDFTSEKQVYFDLWTGDPARVRDQIRQGELVIGTVLAQRTGLKLGDQITVDTREGAKSFRIAGVANDYMVGGLAVFMDRKLAERLLGLEGIQGYIVQADRNALTEVKTRLDEVAGKYGVLVFTEADISRVVDDMVRGVDACLWGILVLGFVVAAFGVVNTLTMNVLEQTRELGLLRIVAMTRRQVRKTIFTQAAIIGTVGLVPGSLAGVALAYLINLATMPALGHPVQFVLHPILIAVSFTFAFTLVVLAAWIPAERAARLNLMEALQYE